MFERSSDDVRITVIDSGDPFNPLEPPGVAPPASLEGAAIGRLGIPLMASSADGISYRRENGQNLLTFRFER